MIELVDTSPQIAVQPAEYERLLGYPREQELSERALELAQWARRWYAQHGRPWIYARQIQALELTDSAVRIDGATFTSPRLRKTLEQAEADSTVVVVVTAGPEVETEAQRLWRDEKPDEYFFLEIYGSAVVEHLVTQVGTRLCAWADARQLAVLPHYSPGYPEWDIAQQPRLLELICRTQTQPLPGHMEVMESGMLRPKKSLLAVFGLTRQVDRVRRLTDLVPCQNCPLTACRYRRVPYHRASQSLEQRLMSSDDNNLTEAAAPPPSVLDASARYVTSIKALRRWVDERLTLERGSDGTIDATFRYEGMTCSNMGHAMTFLYHVKLGSREQGYPILQQQCGPAPGDKGHTRMCRYMNNAEHLMVAIANDKPLLGQPLNDVLSWQRPITGAGCYCEPSSRKHKWGLVLETIHYALAQREKGADVSPPDVAGAALRVS